MRELYDYTMKDVMDYHVERIATKKNVSKKLAKKLFINALLYNVVVEEVDGQIDFLLEIDDFDEE